MLSKRLENISNFYLANIFCPSLLTFPGKGQFTAVSANIRHTRKYLLRLNTLPRGNYTLKGFIRFGPGFG
jgi:hypothetical protein